MIGLPANATSTAGAPLARLVGEFFRFGVVGVVGFVVDSVVLTLAIALGLGPWLGRAVSYVMGASTTFALNRAWTYSSSPRDAVGRRWAIFLAVNLIGFACNYGAYAALITSVPLVAANPVLGVAAGSLAGMVGNFFLSRRFVFGPGGASRPVTT